MKRLIGILTLLGVFGFVVGSSIIDDGWLSVLKRFGEAAGLAVLAAVGIVLITAPWEDDE